MKRKNEFGEFEFGIYEVYYDNDGTIVGWTVHPIAPVGLSETDLRYELNKMLEAFKKDTLLYEEDEDVDVAELN